MIPISDRRSDDGIESVMDELGVDIIITAVALRYKIDDTIQVEMHYITPAKHSTAAVCNVPDIGSKI
jgi:hypothetical protein